MGGVVLCRENLTFRRSLLKDLLVGMSATPYKAKRFASTLGDLPSGILLFPVLACLDPNYWRFDGQFNTLPHELTDHLLS